MKEYNFQHSLKMVNKPIAGELAKGIVFLHGISGGGKGEVVKEILRIASNKGDNEKIEVLYAASGNYFRELAKTPEEELPLKFKKIKQRMKSGKYAETLEGIMPQLENKFKEYFTKILNGEKVMLVLDGFLRVGEFVGEGESDYLGIHVASQVDQVSEAAQRGLKSALDADSGLIDKLREIDPDLCQAILERNEVPHIEVARVRKDGSFTKEVIINAKHVVIQIPPDDGKNLMKFRFQKALQDISRELNMALIDGNQMPENQIKETFDLLKAGILIQSGRFTVQSGELAVDVNLPDRSFDILSPEESRIASDELSEIVKGVVEKLGFSAQNPKSFPTFVKELLKNNGLAFPLGDLREDDQDEVSRESRTDEFENKAKPDIIEAELGVKYDGYKILDQSLSENIVKVENGPSLGIDYPMLGKNARVGAELLMKDLPMVGGGIESIHRGER